MRRKFIDRVNAEGYICSVRYKLSPDGKYYFDVVTEGDDAHFFDLTKEEQEKALTWLRFNVIPAEKPLDGHTSYGMKHILENRTKIYMTNNQFKEAMLLCGCFPAETDELNWHFCMRKSSPMFVLQADRKQGLPMMGDPMDYSGEEYEDHEGCWEYEHGSWVCSECGRAPNREDCWNYEDGEPEFSYCPYCGARVIPEAE